VFKSYKPAIPYAKACLSTVRIH